LYQLLEAMESANCQEITFPCLPPSRYEAKIKISILLYLMCLQLYWKKDLFYQYDD
jgi:hypothetical protein